MENSYRDNVIWKSAKAKSTKADTTETKSAKAESTSEKSIRALISERND